MSKAKGQGTTLGIAIAISIVVVVLAALAATHVRLPKQPKGPTSDAVPTTPAVGIVRLGGDNRLLQQVELFDPKPLFLPTPINNSDPALPAGLRREPGSDFKVIPPKLTFAEYEMGIPLPEPIPVPGDPVQALYTGETTNPFFTFGRINYPYTPLSPRRAFLEVLSAKSGQIVLAAPLDAGSTDNLPSVDWQPLEMMAAVETVGMIGEPTVTSGSGYEDVDNFFRILIAKQFRLGSRLPPGFYLLRIGP